MRAIERIWTAVSTTVAWAPIIAILLATGWLAGCGGAPVRSKSVYNQVGTASYYSQVLKGRKTASGEPYDPQALTAAHPHLPFGTVVRVTHLKNKRSVEVRINDRGPFVKGRIIDLSYSAARQLKMVRQGVARVRVTQTGSR